MKLAQAIAKFLEAQGVRHVFGVSGGANLHLIHGITDATKIQFIPTTHECNAGFSADAYARLTGLGVCLVTSGPGATNAVTAVATSYYDSVPTLYICGQVASHRFGSQYGVRQYGFQETPIVEMVKEITKAAFELDRPANLVHALNGLLEDAVTARKGPVLLSIPDDYQRADVSDFSF